MSACRGRCKNEDAAGRIVALGALPDRYGQIAGSGIDGAADGRTLQWDRTQRCRARVRVFDDIHRIEVGDVDVCRAIRARTDWIAKAGELPLEDWFPRQVPRVHVYASSLRVRNVEERIPSCVGRHPPVRLLALGRCASPGRPARAMFQRSAAVMWHCNRQEATPQPAPPNKMMRLDVSLGSLLSPASAMLRTDSHRQMKKV